MKIFGSISELISTIYRKNSQTITLRPNQATTYTAARDVQLPEGDTAHVVISRTSTDTLTNKTLTAPAISSPTGLVKADVGLSNVDNTSDATKNAATATLTNKTLTSPVINSPTGIVKGDVGLGNVDNTSDATKNAAAATLTNKTLTSPVINSPTGIVKGDVGLGNVDNTSDATKNSASVQLTNKDIDGGTASNTSRVTLPKAGTATLAALTRKEGTIAYDTDLDKVVVDNGAAFSALGGGSGAGELNAVLNASVADSLTGWTDGTSHTTTRITSGSPLDPVVTTALNVSATTTAAESSTSGSKYSITTMPASLTNKKLKVEFYFTTQASQTWAVSVYAGSTRLALSTDASGASLLPAGTTGKFVGYFDTTSATAYSVNFTRTAGSGTAVLKATSVIVGPGIKPHVAVVSAPVAYTPTFTGFGTVAGIKAEYVRVGSKLRAYGNFKAGTPTGVLAKMSLPTGLTVSGSNYTQGSNSLGLVVLNAGAAAQVIAAGQNAYVVYDSTDSAAVYFAGSTGTIASNNVLPSGNANAIFNVDSTVAINFEVEISQWSGSGTLNTAQNDVEYAYNTTTSDADDTTSFGYGPTGNTFPGVITGTIRSKRVRFLSPIQNTDILTLEYKSGASAVWIPVAGYDINNGICQLQNQNGTYYGFAVNSTSINATDVDVVFGRYQYALSTYGAAGGAWSTGGGFWRLKKEKAGVAVGFGLLSGTASGLMPSNHTNLDDVAATRLGLKSYAHGTTYNGGIAPTITLIGGGGSLSSVPFSFFMPYQMQDGTWRCKFNVEVLLSSTARTAINLAVNGVAFYSTGVNQGQAISGCAITGGPNFQYAFVTGSSLIIGHTSLATTEYSMSGDVKLDSKPTWAY